MSCTEGNLELFNWNCCMMKLLVQTWYIQHIHEYSCLVYRSCKTAYSSKCAGVQCHGVAVIKLSRVMICIAGRPAINHEVWAWILLASVAAFLPHVFLPLYSRGAAHT